MIFRFFEFSFDENANNLHNFEVILASDQSCTESSITEAILELSLKNAASEQFQRPFIR